VANFGPHELRAVFGTTLLDNKVPINTVADLMGHQNIQTTRIYDGGKKQRMHDGIQQLKQ
jgi:site-specific recombinase XerD